MCLVAQSCSTLCDPLDCGPSGSSVHGDSPGKNTGASRHALLQGILTALNTGSIPTIVTDFFFKFHYPGFHFGGLKKKKSLMNRILSQLEIEGFTLLVSRKWRLGRILFLELKGHLWPRNVWFHERCSSILSYLIYPRNGEMLKSVTSSDLFPPSALLLLLSRFSHVRLCVTPW